MKNKKGVSPLIATILLVAFAITLAAIVSNYVISKTKEFKPDLIVQDSLLCDEVNLGFSVDPPTDTQVKDWFCLSNSNPPVLAGINIINKGKFAVWKYHKNIDGNDFVIPDVAGIYVSGALTAPLYPEKKQQMLFQIKPSLVDHTKQVIKLTPIVRDPEKPDTLITCPRSTLSINYDNLCKDLLGDHCSSSSNGLAQCSSSSWSIDNYHTTYNPNAP